MNTKVAEHESCFIVKIYVEKKLKCNRTLDEIIEQRFLFQKINDKINFNSKVLFKLDWSNFQYWFQIFVFLTQKQCPEMADSIQLHFPY